MSDLSHLAINGGPPAVTCGPFPWPPDDAAIHSALQSVWRDGDWGRYHGTRCERLREELAKRHGVEHAHLCSSGTAAVELALRAVGVQPGDGVLLAGYEFSGNFRAIESVGAVPVLADIDPRTWSMDVAALAEQVDVAEEHCVRAVVVSHLHGGLADMVALRELAQARGWRVVEDACQATGASLASQPVGSWGDVGVLSFGGSKLLTAGRGGALLTDDATIAQRLRVLNGRGNDAYPLSELQAAVLLPQLETLAKHHATREEAAKLLGDGLRECAEQLESVSIRSDASHAYFKFAFAVRGSNPEKPPGIPEVQHFVAALQAENAPVDHGFRGFVTRSERRCRRLGSLEHSAAAVDATVTLYHPVLLAGRQAVDQLIAAITKVSKALLTDA